MHAYCLFSDIIDTSVFSIPCALLKSNISLRAIYAGNPCGVVPAYILLSSCFPYEIFLQNLVCVAYTVRLKQPSRIVKHSKIQSETARSLPISLYAAQQLSSPLVSSRGSNFSLWRNTKLGIGNSSKLHADLQQVKYLILRDALCKQRFRDVICTR